MLLHEFVRDREASWRRFEALLAKAEHEGIGSFSDRELEEFGVLYRRGGVHLARIRTRTSDQRLIAYLNSLVARGHALIYFAPPGHPLRSAWRLFLTEFPRTFVRTLPFQAVAVCLLLVSAATGFLATSVNPQNGYAFLSGSEVRGPGSDPELLREALQHGRDTGTGYRALFSSWLFAHNTRVGFLAFAAGIFFCVPTLILIIYNGLTLGAMSAVYHAAGLPVDWWAWVLPHGITELLAISIVSAAGLLLGYSLIDPQGRPRLQALAGRGRQAVVLVVGSIPMLLLAALVEGFLRQSGLSTAARLAFAAGSLVCWLYFFRTGTVREHRETSSALPVGVRADSVPVSPGTSRSAAR